MKRIQNVDSIRKKSLNASEVDLFDQAEVPDKVKMAYHLTGVQKIPKIDVDNMSQKSAKSSRRYETKSPFADIIDIKTALNKDKDDTKHNTVPTS